MTVRGEAYINILRIMLNTPTMVDLTFVVWKSFRVRTTTRTKKMVSITRRRWFQSQEQ